MAQNLDELTLKIEADASEANAALDGLIGKLGELSKALTQVKGNTKINVTTRQVNSLSQSVNSSSRAATRFGAAFKKSFSTLGNCTKTVAKFGLTVGKGMFIGTPTAMAKGMLALGKGAASAVSGFAKLVTGARSTKERFDELVTSVGSLVLKLAVLKKAFDTLWGSIQKSMNFIETFHYFDVSFKKIGADAMKDDWQQLGYDSAESYAESFKTRALLLTSEMSGFFINRETGEAKATGQVSLGLDPNMLMNYQAQFGQMANGLGMTSQAALNTSKALTMLGADWSALRNIGFEESYTKMASALAGQTRAVRSLGVDISQATLAQYAQNIGLETAVSKLDGAAKAELRMIAILDQSRVAWGDMAKTLNTPANQYRLLSQNVNTLARAIGNIFLPVVQKVLPYINGLVIALQRLFTWLAKFLGIKSTGGDGGMGGMSDAFADMADDGMDMADGTDAIADAADDANDALDNAADTAEKLKNTILGFDELNVLNSPNESSTAGTGGNGSGGNGSGSGGAAGMNPGDMGLLDDALSSLLDQYETEWLKALHSLSNQAQEIADAIVGAFASKDWEGLGKLMAGGIEWALQKVYDFLDPEKMYPKLRAVAEAITTTVNSFVTAFPADLAGRTIGRFVNDYVYFMNLLYDGVEWGNIGHQLGVAFLGLVSTIQPYELGRLFMQKFNAAVSILEGFLEEMQGHWELVGHKVEQFILGGLSMINPEQIANVINLAVEGATDFLGGIGWENLGTQIGEKLEKLILYTDPHKIAGLISMAIKSALLLAKGFLEEMKDTWDDLGTKVGTLLAEALKGIPTGDIEIVVSDAMMAVLDFLSSGINAFRKEGGFADLAEKTATLINTAFADPEKWDKLGNALRDLLKGSLEFLLKLEGLIKWTEIGTEVHRLVKRAIDDQELWSDLGEALEKWCKGIVNFINAAWPSEEEWYKIGHRISELLQKVPWGSVFGTVIRAIVVAAKGLWDGLGDTFAGRIVQGIIAFKLSYGLLSPFFSGIGMIIQGKIVGTVIGRSIQSTLGAGLTTGATNAAAQVSANTGLKLFSGSIAGVLGSAAAIVGIGYAFLEACHTIQLGVETLQGGNGKATDEGNAIDGLIKAMQTFNALSPGQSEQLWKMKEDMESAGASSEEVFNAIIGKMGEWQISSGDMERALAIIKENGWLTDEMVAQLSTHIGDLKTDSDIAASGMENLYSKMDFSSYGTNPIEDFYSLEEIVGRVGTATGLSADQMTSLSTALYAQNPASLTAQAAYDLICGKVEEMDGNVSGVADVFSILFPNAVKTGTDSAKSSLSGLATDGSASMSELERQVSDSSSKSKDAITKNMADAKKDGTKDAEDMASDMGGSFTDASDKSDKEFKNLKSNVNTQLGQTKTDANTKTSEMATQLHTRYSTIATSLPKHFKDLGKDISEHFKDIEPKSTTAANITQLKLNMEKGAGSVASAFKGVDDSIAAPFANVDSKISSNINNASLYNIGQSASQSFANGFESTHVTLPHIYKQGDDRYYYGDGAWFDIPYFDIRWYAKGGVFTKPTLAGFGEAGAEAALPLENKAVMARIASAIVDASPSGMGMSADDMSDAVATGVAMALAQNPQTVEVIVQSILKTDDEALAQSVSRGRARLDQRYNATPSYSY